jgi:hypothetical protein
MHVVQIPAEGRNASFLKTVKIGFGLHTTTFYFRGLYDRNVMLTTLLHLAPRLRKSGAIYLLLLYALIAGKGT